VAASGVNFLGSVAAGAEFWLSEDRFALISFRSARSVSSCDQSFTNRDQRAQSQVEIEASHRSRSALSVSNCDQSFTLIAIGAFGFKLD
jgi:hypothetical protein